MVLSLVPWLKDSYQPSAWTAVSEDGGTLRYANGLPAEVGSVKTLDQYAELLAAVVAEQASGGPPVPLAIPLIQPGDLISPARFLGLGDSAEVSISKADSSDSTELEPGMRSVLMSSLEEDILVEAATLGGREGNLTITFKLTDGHVWEFEYDPTTGSIIYPPGGLQAKLTKASKDALRPALSRVQ